VALIGVGGRGTSFVTSAAAVGGVVTAICDVDRTALDVQGQHVPAAAKFSDYRQMFETAAFTFDAVVISCPDHHHALATALALGHGKHVFCEKPLTRTVYEARLIGLLARDRRLATQLGNQGSASDGFRRSMEVVQANFIGPIQEVHVWSNRPIWPQGINRPAGEDPVPATLSWDAWLGPAPFRPFKSGVYHPFNWRGWKDFGGGAVNDMGPHQLNLPARALQLGSPTLVVCEQASNANSESYPASSRIRFEFPARPGWPALMLWWYDGGAKPAAETLAKLTATYGASLPTSGCLLIGTQGQLFASNVYNTSISVCLAGESVFVDSATHAASRNVPVSLPRSPGHFEEWANAIHDGSSPYSNFALMGPLSEIAALGAVATAVPNQSVDWDGARLYSPGCPAAMPFVKPVYRSGWEAGIYDDLRLTISLESEKLKLRWPSFSGRNYQPQYSDGLAADTWHSMGAPVPGTGATNTIEHIPTNAARYFRLEEVP
jgi:hypothetical protein